MFGIKHGYLLERKNKYESYLDGRIILQKFFYKSNVDLSTAYTYFKIGDCIILSSDKNEKQEYVIEKIEKHHDKFFGEDGVLITIRFLNRTFDL